jgi:hypothetical protein
LKVEGLYIFGGMNGERVLNNDVRVLKFAKKQLEWTLLSIEGKPPEPRVSACMNFFEELNIIIINGGKNDFKSIYMNDIFVLDLEHHLWIKVGVIENLPMERAEHCSCVYKNKLYIFGGIKEKKFLGSDLYVLNIGIFRYKKDVFDKKKLKELKHVEGSQKTELNSFGKQKTKDIFKRSFSELK